MVDEQRQKSTDGTSRRTFMKATGAATATAALGSGAASAAGRKRDDVEALLRELSLEQKVGQMTQVAIGTFDPDSEAIPDSFGVDTLGEYFSELGVGSILSGGAAPPSFDGQTVVEGINALQAYNLQHADHEIPFLYGVDATHGNGLLEGATVFPQRMNMGATRDPELIEQAERHTSDSTASMGAHWTFAPTTDLQRDPRWGRFFEGISEDPKLTGDVSRARARGLEDDDRLTACVKHFGAYSIPNNGNDRAPASTSMRDLRTNLLPPYREALEAEPGSVMINSGAVNGKPAHASHWLLTDILRNRYGFEGVVLSDWDDLWRLVTNHDYAPDFRSATRQAINAGIDVYMIGDGGDAPAAAPAALMQRVADHSE
jgi:beta-glucosidase